MVEGHLNEPTFVARLGGFTALRAERRENDGDAVLIASGDVEERQIVDGRYRRCDIRLSSKAGRRLASGEVKRPEVPEGRDVRSEALVSDAREKALARGLKYYFTCNMADLVLFEVSERADLEDTEVASFKLAPVEKSSDVEAYWEDIEEKWVAFLDDLEERLQALTTTPRSVTTTDVIALRDAIREVAAEALDRATRRLEANPTLLDETRTVTAETFGLSLTLSLRRKARFREELYQALLFGVFVIAQKLVLYRVLEDTGPRRKERFSLDPITIPDTSSDPSLVRAILNRAVAHAIERSGDYETAFLPKPLEDLVFTPPVGEEEASACDVGGVWHALLEAIGSVSWVAISRNLVGFLYEVIVDPRYRHELGQFYTREDVVDILTCYAVRNVADVVLDPAAGGGSFLRSAYDRLRALGATHEGTLQQIWGVELAAFAGELSTIALATADVREAAAYPRVILSDFFDVRPSEETDLKIPGEGKVTVPEGFDAIIGNPPYISYRRQTNQEKILRALAASVSELRFPRFSGKSDSYIWFLAHATRFLKDGGRLGFVVSSSLLFADYGIPAIRFISRHYVIEAVVDSMVERWFPDADTNTVLLLLRRCHDKKEREQNMIRFVRLRRPLSQLLPPPDVEARRGELEELVTELVSLEEGGEDPRFLVSHIPQGADGGLSLKRDSDEVALDENEEEDE